MSAAELSSSNVRRHVLITGSSGYLGTAVAAALASHGHGVRGLVRRGSEGRLPPGVDPVFGNALDPSTWSAGVTPADTLVHLVGTPRPNPSKAKQFQEIDLASIRATLSAASAGTVRHIVYVSVAHPAPVMKAYIAVRQEGERLIRASGLRATILRPWYVLGRGHRWPYLLLPVYALLACIPATAEGATRLGLVSHRQMVAALVHAVENPPDGVRIVEVPEIRRGAQ